MKERVEEEKEEKERQVEIWRARKLDRDVDGWRREEERRRRETEREGEIKMGKRVKKAGEP